MRKDEKMNDAVSPVVGVMLMLVVTIIIAALVSAFAGGLADTSTTLPTLVLKGTYSQSGGLVITHAGGDTVSLTDVSFRTIPSESMGPDHARYAWDVNKTFLQKNGKNFYFSNGTYDPTNTQFPAGSILTVDALHCMDYYTAEERDGILADAGYTGNLLNYASEFVNGNALNLWGGLGEPKSVYLAQYQFRSPGNLGSYYYLDMVDSTGSIIARAKVTITA